MIVLLINKKQMCSDLCQRELFFLEVFNLK